MKPVKRKVLSKDEKKKQHKNTYVKKRHALELFTCKKTKIQVVKTVRNA